MRSRRSPEALTTELECRETAKPRRVPMKRRLATRMAPPRHRLHQGAPASFAMGDQPTARRCIFCGQPARTREHLWPDWMQRALPDLAAMRLPHNRASSTGSEQSYRNRPFRAKVRAVCRACNNGWMSEIEAAARPAAARMIRGEAHVLDRTEQAAVATWAILKAMVFEHAHDGAYVLIPDQHFRQMYQRRSVPDATQVWVGRVDPHATAGAPVFATFESRALTDPKRPVPDEPPDAYTTTLSINQLAIAVFGSKLPGAPRLNHGPDVLPAIRQIWPVEQATLTWPFEPTLTVRGLERLASGPVTTTVQLWIPSLK